jgi:hypothetical protein
MITQTEIDLGEDFSFGLLIKQDVNTGEWIPVLDSNDVQRMIIHT